MENTKQSLLSSELIGIEAECRGVQDAEGATPAALWWRRNFAHKYIDYVYDAELERVVKRGSSN